MGRGTGLGRTAAAIGLVTGLLVLAPAPPAAGEVYMRYSGHVVEVDLHRGVLVVEELGRRGAAVRHEVRIDVDTPLVAASRLQGRGTAFGELPVSLVDVLVGDFVVVEGEDQAGQTVAHRVTIVETRRRP
jgi:hypothetical protein